MSVLADTGRLIVLSGLVGAVFLVLSLVLVIVICFRRYSRRKQKYRSVNRDLPPAELSLKAFPEVVRFFYFLVCIPAVRAQGSEAD